MDLPNIPGCIDDRPDLNGKAPHNFMPLGKKSVYCTKCSTHVKFTSSKKDK